MPRSVAVVLGMALLGLALGLAWRALPPHWDPLAPLNLGAPATAVTPWKLARLSRDPAACFAALSRAGITVARLPDRAAAAPGCGLQDALRLPDVGGGAALRPAGPAATCALAAAWLLFERHTLQPAAQRHLGSGVAAVAHLGTYACRNVNNAATGARSQHAAANAIDIAGVTLRDGRQVTLLRHWGRPGPESAFLRDLHAGACRWFGVVLGPDHDAAHRDHLHLDRGPGRLCR
jgi:hypothetical protein